MRLRVASGLQPATPRHDARAEGQRLEAIAIVRAEGTFISAEADRFEVAREAIAGAILWEALENPSPGRLSRHGPGKVHARERHGKSAAEVVEHEGRVPSCASHAGRARRLRQPRTAITYIAAIMRSHADRYRSIAAVDISGDVGVLCTLYQGGDSEGRARRLVQRRRQDPAAAPIAADEMGPWVEQHLSFVRSLLPDLPARADDGRAAAPDEQASA